MPSTLNVCNPLIQSSVFDANARSSHDFSILAPLRGVYLPFKVSHKCVLQECQGRVSGKRVFYKSVTECETFKIPFIFGCVCFILLIFLDCNCHPAGRATTPQKKGGSRETIRLRREVLHTDGHCNALFHGDETALIVVVAKAFFKARTADASVLARRIQKH